MSGEMLIPSFVAELGAWSGAIYALAAGYGPELVLVCVHRHETMRAATRCAESELRWARRVVALAAEQRPS